MLRVGPCCERPPRPQILRSEVGGALSVDGSIAPVLLWAVCRALWRVLLGRVSAWCEGVWLEARVRRRAASRLLAAAGHRWPDRGRGKARHHKWVVRYLCVGRHTGGEVRGCRSRGDGVPGCAIVKDWREMGDCGMLFLQGRNGGIEESRLRLPTFGSSCRMKLLLTNAGGKIQLPEATVNESQTLTCCVAGSMVETGGRSIEWGPPRVQKRVSLVSRVVPVALVPGDGPDVVAGGGGFVVVAGRVGAVMRRLTLESKMSNRGPTLSYRSPNTTRVS